VTPRSKAHAGDHLGLDFFGAGHVLFASDCPFDKEKGPGYIRDTIKVLNSLALSNAEREKICHRNAESCSLGPRLIPSLKRRRHRLGLQGSIETSVGAVWLRCRKRCGCPSLPLSG